MNRSSICITAVLCVFLASAANAAERPNILFILTEDQGAHLNSLARFWAK